MIECEHFTGSRVRNFTPEFKRRAVAMAVSLNRINLRLEEIREELKYTQPRDHGAIMLNFFDCKNGCIGCPHSSWAEWRYITQRNGAKRFVPVVIKNPMMKLKRKKEFADGYKQTREYVLEALDLIEKKKKIVARMTIRNYWEGEEGDEF